jgi:hypothetical protein
VRVNVWAYLASVGAIRSGTTLASALPDMIERAIGWVITRAAEWPEPDDPALEALGYLGNDAGATLAAHTLEKVVLPGLEQLDVDLAPARARIAERNWLASSSA